MGWYDFKYGQSRLGLQGGLKGEHQVGLQGGGARLFNGSLPKFPSVVRPIGGLSEPPMLQVGPPDLVHRVVRVLLRQEVGQGHVEIV